MRIKLFFVFTAIVTSVSSGQSFQTFGIGLGFTYDAYTLSKSNPVFINDSIFFVDEESISNPINGPIRSDSRETIYIESHILKKERANLSLALYYSRQWPSITLVRLSDRINPVFTASYSPSIAKSELFLPVNANIQPFSKIKLLKKISIGVGIGPSIKFGNIATRIDYDLNLRNKRKDSVYYETHYQFAKNAFKTLTFNYNWSMQLELTKRINFRIAGRGSIGSVTKPFNVFGERHKVPLRRRGLVYLITYSFSLPTSKRE